jgi:hypothetical protein
MDTGRRQAPIAKCARRKMLIVNGPDEGQPSHPFMHPTFDVNCEIGACFAPRTVFGAPQGNVSPDISGGSL